MKYVWTRFRNASLRLQLTLPVILTLMLLVAGHTVLFSFAANYVRENMRSGVESVTVSMCSHIDSRIRSIIERLYYIKLDPSIEETLTGFLLQNTASSEATTMSRLSDTLPLYKATEPLLSSIVLYTPKRVFSSEGRPMLPYIVFEETALWKSIQDRPGTLVFTDPMQEEIFRVQRQVISIVHRFRITGYPSDCLLIGSIDINALTNYIRQALPDDGSEAFLINAKGIPITLAGSAGSILLEEQKDLVLSAIGSDAYLDVSVEGEQFLLHEARLETAPWYVVYMHSQQSFSSMLGTIRVVYLLSLLAILVLGVSLLSVFGRTVTRPLAMLCRHIRASTDQQQLPGFSYPYTNEIGEVARNYNSMASRIRRLLEEQRQIIRRLEEEKARADTEQALKRQAELQALQAQINPHFLYNTLDSIHWKAESAGAKDISRMTSALANLFRIGLSRGREIITVEQELTHAESYLKIQSIRYNDQLTYRIHAEPEVLALHTIKLILQPLVENAIYHGIRESDHAGTVEIIARRQQETLILQVSDNGLGIPPEHLARLRRDLAQGLVVTREGYGIFNVNERIRLHFGPEYGLTLDSIHGQGTTATVSLPCITAWKEEANVPNDDRG